MIALLDNTVLSNFALIERPELVRLALGNAAATTAETYAEYQTGEQIGRLPRVDWTWLTVLRLDESERTTFDQICERLNAGEAACLAIAAARGYLVFTDDRDARETALQMQVPISGTLGILVRLIHLEQLSLAEANDLLRRMIAAGFRAPLSDLGKILPH